MTAVVKDLLAEGRLFEVLDFWLQRWAEHRDAEIADALLGFAAALEPLPPPTVEQRLVGFLRPSLRRRDVFADDGSVFETRELPRQPMAARSDVPRQVEADVRWALRPSHPSEAWRRVATLSPSPLVDAVVREAIARRVDTIPPSVFMRHASQTLVLTALQLMSPGAERRAVQQALEALPPPLPDSARTSLLGDIHAATDLAHGFTTRVAGVMKHRGWAEPASRGVMVDQLLEAQDPWGEVVAAQLRGVAPDDTLFERHRLRWSLPLGPGVAHERTQFEAGVPVTVTVESLVELTSQRPSPYWAHVKEVRVPFGYHDGNYTPDVAEQDDVARFFSSLTLDRLTGAQWVAPDLQRAAQPVRIEALRFGSIPALDFASTGLSLVKRLVATAVPSESLEALFASTRGSALVVCELSVSGHYRGTLWPAEGRADFEALTPPARELLERQAVRARRLGWRQVTVRGRT